MKLLRPQTSALAFSLLSAVAVGNADARTAVKRYNVVWNTPSENSSGSMPLGNGDVGLNVWVEEDAGLQFYISKTDSWSENARLLKLGKIRIQLDPNPFQSGLPFKQALSLRDGSILIGAGNPDEEVRLRIWVDANAPVVRVEVESDKPCDVRASLDIWRTEPRELGRKREIFSAYGLSGAPFPTVVMPDTVLEDQPDRIVWYHRNETSVWPKTLELQGLSSLIDMSADPLLHRTFGGAVLGTGMAKAGPVTLESKRPKKQHRISIHVATAQTETPGGWITEIQKTVAANDNAPLARTRTRHTAWWEAFWDRSWVHVNDRSAGDAASTAELDDDPAFKISQGYALQRFISACAGRGAFPLKFNGSIFTVDSREPDEVFDADYRRWGGPYWFQNTRLCYWPMLGSGDFEMMLPLFRMFLDALPLAKARNQIYYQHGGAYFPETMYFWGTYANDNYGWEREGKSDSTVDNHYIRYYWSTSLELLVLMLDYYTHTGDEEFLRESLFPLSGEILQFFDVHFPRDAQGKLRIDPAQALETWQKAVNPLPVIAGLQFVLDKLTALPKEITPDDQRRLWERIRAELPAIPMAEEEGKAYVLPAEEFDELKNSENPELYAVFPYRLFGVGKPDLQVGRLTFEKRLVKRTGGWTQDPIQAAYLGLTDVAREYTTQNFHNHHAGSRFPAFWGPNFDWIPDQDHGNVSLMALQVMLMQCDGESILLFPAWPTEWDVAFKLHAPMQTTVEGVLRSGKVESLRVTPESRAKDVKLLLPAQ